MSQRLTKGQRNFQLSKQLNHKPQPTEFTVSSIEINREKSRIEQENILMEQHIARKRDVEEYNKISMINYSLLHTPKKQNRSSDCLEKNKAQKNNIFENFIDDENIVSHDAVWDASTYNSPGCENIGNAKEIYKNSEVSNNNTNSEYCGNPDGACESFCSNSNSTAPLLASSDSDFSNPMTLEAAATSQVVKIGLKYFGSWEVNYHEMCNSLMELFSTCDGLADNKLKFTFDAAFDQIYTECLYAVYHNCQFTVNGVILTHLDQLTTDSLRLAYAAKIRHLERKVQARVNEIRTAVGVVLENITGSNSQQLQCNEYHGHISVTLKNFIVSKDFDKSRILDFSAACTSTTKLYNTKYQGYASHKNKREKKQVYSIIASWRIV